MCYACHKPEVTCICERIRRVDNRTGIILLQHPRERFHPLGTARIAALGLSNVRHELSCSAHGRSLARPMDVPAGTGLLYPRPDAIDLEHVTAENRPRQLVILDGTWHHAHTLYRENGWLKDLPHYQLSPESPSRYRIRREPRAECVSTLESIVLALRILEPDTSGLDGLIDVFDRMIDDQIRYVQSGVGRPRRKRSRPRAWRAIPRGLVEDYQRLVVVTAESSSRRTEQAGLGKRELIYLVASRPSTGESFAAAVRPSMPVTDRHLNFLELTRSTLDRGLSADQFKTEFREFLGTGAVIAAWHQSTKDLLLELGFDPNLILLKSVYHNVRKGGVRGDLEHLMASERLKPQAVPQAGRAARRLGNAMSMVELLRREAHAAQGRPPPKKI